MPRQIGLGHSIQDDDIDGDIDFDFFEGNGEGKDSEDTLNAPADASGKSAEDNGSLTGRRKNELGGKEIMPSKSVRDLSKDFVEEKKVCQDNSGTNDDVRESTFDDTFESDTESENSLDVTVTDSSSSSSSSFYEDDSFESLSESEITDVTPLSSANISPLPASPIRYKIQKKAFQKSEKLFIPEKKPLKIPESKSKDGNSSTVDLDLLVQAILKLERDRKSNGSALSKDRESSKGSTKKNMSFTDDQVRKIDRENKILLQRILDQRTSPKAVQNAPVMQKPSSSSINRLRQQKRIEAENMALLKRIQSARPTRELSRRYLLKTPPDSRVRSRAWSEASVLKSSASIESVETPIASKSGGSIPIPIIGNGRTRVRSNRAMEVRTEWNSNRRKLKS